MEIPKKRGRKPGFKPTLANLLTDAQKRQIDANYEVVEDLLTLAMLVFNREDLKLDSDEVQAIKRYIANKIKEKEKAEDAPINISFTKEQEEFIVREVEAGASVSEVAKSLFPYLKDQQRIALKKECRAIVKVAEKNGIPLKRHQGNLDEYKPIRTTSQAIRKIIAITGKDIEEASLTHEEKQAIQKMMRQIQTSRFVRLANGLTKIEDREIFEESFISQTWDKSDLTAEDYSLYIVLSQAHVQQAILSAKIQQLRDRNERMTLEDEDRTASINAQKEVESTIKSLKECEDTIVKVTDKVQQSRSNRKNSENTGSITILTLIKTFCEEKNRDDAIKLSKMIKAAAEQELDKFSAMEDFEVRVLGVRREDII